MTEKRRTGIVKWFAKAKGYGFIQPEGKEGNGADVFVHISALSPGMDLKEGQRVSYELSPSNKGKTAAVNIKLQD